MASRLSEDHGSGMSGAGALGFSLQPAKTPELSPAAVDLDALLSAKDPRAAVEAVPAPILYQAVMTQGPEDCVEILQLVSAEQLVRFFDYDAWSRGAIDPVRTRRWLSLYRDSGPGVMAGRLRDLEEEFQIALFSRLIDLVELEQYERLPAHEQDQYERLPCGELFYRIKAHDPDTLEFYDALIQDALALDVAWAYSLLSHAAYMPPNEQESLALQFRNARLEDDGFVSPEESLQVFRTIDTGGLVAKWRGHISSNASRLPIASGQPGQPLLYRALDCIRSSDEAETAERVTQGLAYLGNTLASACGASAEDTQDLRTVLRHVQSTLNLVLEFLAGQDQESAAMILIHEHPKTLFRAGWTLVQDLVRNVLDRMEEAGLPEISRIRTNLLLSKRAAAQNLIDEHLVQILGFERAEEIKALCNLFPLVLSAANREPPESAPVPVLVFEPVNSVSSLQSLGARMDGIIGMLTLAVLPETHMPAGRSLDQAVSARILKFLAGHPKDVSAPTAAELAVVMEMPASGIDALCRDYVANVDETFRIMADVMPEATGWNVSSSLPAGLRPAVSLSVAQVTGEVSDLIMRLMMARTGAAGTAGLESLINQAGTGAGAEASAGGHH